MAEKKFEFRLAKAARSEGGDRYETEVEGERKPWAVYVPQAISRVNNIPASDLQVTLR